MKTEENKKRRGFSLRLRLTILVTFELIVILVLASLFTSIINAITPDGFRIPQFVELGVIGIIVGSIVTNIMSKWFFNPIKELTKALAKVADGDFKTRLTKVPSAREMQEIYSGFNLMAKELDATEILQSDFVSNVSHEFKTPISAIEGYATLLQDCENLNPDQRQYVEKINFNTERLSGLVGNILLLSKIDNQHIQTNRTTFRMDEQIRQSIVMLEQKWEEKDILLDVDMDSMEYTGNESMLHHIWDNIIGNAIKFSPVGGTVRILLKQQDKNAVFTVEDEGPGVSEEAKKHIFDKFYQEDSSHKSEGNGLGLALVKRIVAFVGGTIAVHNREAGGCQFTVTVPDVTSAD